MAKAYLFILASILTILVSAHSSPCQACPALRVETTSGQVAGFINSTTASNVAQFLGVPYAEDPVGKLRFAQPIAKSPSVAIINATKLGPSCPQYRTSTPIFFTVAAPEYYIEGPMAEECLSLNVWTPVRAVSSRETGHKRLSNENEEIDQIEKLPVIIFIHGGQFTVGGSRVANHLPDRWVERSQKHVVVTIKFARSVNFVPESVCNKLLATD